MGGGSGSGSVSYPTYMQNIHSNWLDGSGDGSGVNVRIGYNKSISQLISNAIDGSSPYAGYIAPSVDVGFLGVNVGLQSFTPAFQRLASYALADIDTIYKNNLVDEDSYITNLLAAESALLDDEVNSKSIPRLQAGMIDANAVQSSSFVMGAALILGQKLKALTKADAEIRLQRLQQGTDFAFRRAVAKSEALKQVTLLSFDGLRIYTQTRHDMDGLAYEFAHKDRTFDLSMYQYGNGVLASIAGAASVTNQAGSGKTTGGAIAAVGAGASMGSVIPGVGAGIGAVVGLAAYELS